MLEILILTGVGVWLILALRSCFRGGGCSGSCGGSCANWAPATAVAATDLANSVFLPILDKIRWALPVKTPIDFDTLVR